jgi:hypothetical protein
MGIVISLSTLFTIVLNLVIGKYTDTKHRKKLIKFGGAANILIWIARIFIKGPISIFFTDSMYRVSLSSIFIPMWTRTYAYASKTHRYMKTVILYDQSVNLSRTLMLLVAFLIVFFTGKIEYSFITPALTSFLYFFI